VGQRVPPSRVGLVGVSRERVPPHNTEAEESVLGGMLLDQAAAGEILALLGPDDFYRPAHRTVFAAVAAVYAAGGPLDTVTVSEHLRRAGVLADIGGAPFLFTLISGVPTVAHVGHYARVVREASVLRRLIDAGTRIRQLGFEAPQDPDQALAVAAELVDRIRDRSRPRADDQAVLEIDDFLNEAEPDYDWLIPELLERGDRVILTGLEGTGKSMLYRQVAIQAGSGIHPFTLEPISPVRVLLIDCENPPRQVKRELRVLRLKAGGQLKRGMVYPVVQPQGIDLYGQAADVAWLEAKIKAAAPDLVIIGPLYKLATGDPTSEEVARKVSAVLDDLRVRYGFALLIEAHVPHGPGGSRPGRPYGASMWLRWPEFGLHLGEKGTLTHWRGQRDEREWPSSLKRGGDWPWTPDRDPREVLWGRIVARVHEDGRTYSIAVLSRLLGIGKGSVQRALEKHRAEWEELRKGLSDAE